MPMNGAFDASQFAPKQGGEAHPIGEYDAYISDTSIVPTKDNDGGMFVVEFTTPSGSINQRYNLWNKSEKAVEIAHGQLSALCHATGVFRLDWTNDGAALRNARCKIKVAYQKGQEPTADNPAGGYVEVKKVFDAAGNEPGKAPMAPQPQAQPQQQPAPAQAGTPWANPAPAAAQQPAAAGWGQPAAQPANPAPAPNAGSTPWGTPAGNAPAAQKPPWAT